MAKLLFAPEDLRRGFAIAKLVRPISGDYILRVVDSELWINSTDRRRQVHAVVSSISSDSDGSSSDDFFLSIDRSALFDSELTQIAISVTNKGLLIKAEGDGQTRQATVKKRVDSARRSPMSPKPSVSGVVLPSKKFEEIIRQISCSALVKSTKTDEDRKINQVHFYQDENCGYSNARVYASVVYMDGLSLDLSVSSDDLPALRNFCSRISDNVKIGQDKTKMFISDPVSGSVISFSRVACSKPILNVLSDDGYEIEIEVDRIKLVKALQWTNMAREGTRRVSFKALNDSLVMSCNGQEVSNLPVSFLVGNSLSADFPSDLLASIVSHTDSENVMMKYKHKTSPSILEVCNSTKSDVRARHFLQSMKERG